MRKDVNWGIFQDPMLTIIALILLSTLSLIVPSAENEDDSTLDTTIFEKEIAIMQDYLESLNEQVELLKNEVMNLQNIRPSDSFEDTANETLRKEIEELLSKIASINAKIKSQTYELSLLKKKLEDLQTRSENANLIEKMEQRIKQLQESIENLKRMLKQLEKELDEAKDRKQKMKRKQSEQEKQITKIKREIEIQKDLIAELEKQKIELKRTFEKSSGIAKYSKQGARNKDPLAFECRDNKIILIDENNYNVKAFAKMYNQQIYKYYKLTKKTHVLGESINKIGDSNSIFKRELKQTTNYETYLYFYVHNNSFDVFQKAREIAWEKGFAVGWIPFAGEAFIAGTSGETQSVR